MLAHVHNTTLWYDDVGPADGTPLLCIHGFPHDHRLWEPQRDALSKHYRVITPDLRGFGASGTNGPYSMDQFADDLAALLTQLGIPRAVICGLSMGGYVALAFWRRHARHVRALIFADTKATADDDATRTKRQQLIQVAMHAGASAVADSQVTGMVGATTRADHPELVEHVRDMLAAAPVEGIVGALEAMMVRPDSTALLPTIGVPALCIVGDQDVISPVKDMRAMCAAIPHGELRVIDDAGHVSNVEQPDAFNEAVAQFVARL